MPLVDLEVPTDAVELPPPVKDFLLEADQRIDRFRFDHLIPGFVPSDYAAVYPVLRHVAVAHLAPGTALCEWGSGFGVVAALAAMVGFQACGIEIERDLVDHARLLAADFNLAVEFVCGSFIPPGGEALADSEAEAAWLTMGGPDGHEELGLEPDDFDVIFAYPWPGEEHVITDLFERYAAAGALLVTYHGREDLRLRRKATRRRRSR